MFQQLLKVNVKAIRSFMAIVESRGVTAAQAKLNLSQSVISTHLIQLEDHLGVTLCQRGRGGFALTEEGQAVYEACLAFSDAGAEFNRRLHYIKQLDFSQGGHVRLAIADQLPLQFSQALHRVLAASYQKNPKIHFSIRLQSPVTMTALVAANECDLGLGYFSRMLPSLTYDFALNETQQLYCGKAHPLFDCSTPPLKVLESDYAWVERSYKAPVPFAAFEPEHLSATAYHMEATLHFILAGTHLGFLPIDIAKPYVSTGQLRPLLPARLFYQVSHHWIYKAPLNRHAEMFLNSMQKALLSTLKNTREEDA